MLSVPVISSSSFLLPQPKGPAQVFFSNDPKLLVNPLLFPIALHAHFSKGFPGGSDSKASAYNAGDPGLIPGSERSSGEGNGNPHQYSCLENPTDGGA